MLKRVFGAVSILSSLAVCILVERGGRVGEISSDGWDRTICALFLSRGRAGRDERERNVETIGLRERYPHHSVHPGLACACKKWSLLSRISFLASRLCVPHSSIITLLSFPKPKKKKKPSGKPPPNIPSTVPVRASAIPTPGGPSSSRVHSLTPAHHAHS